MDDVDRLLRGLSTYQDVVLAGRTVRRGVRDCERRWEAIAPHLPSGGVLLDVGANFCWFCLKWCAEGPDRLALALEADLRSAAVARYVLASHEERRIALCTARAGADAAARCEQAGQRFAAALCLSVLHWIPDHREFLTGLGRIADRIFVEQPSPHEAGAGVTAIRREIGPAGPYLTALFPNRPVTQLAEWTAHRTDEWPRELWLVGPVTDATPNAQASIDVGALLDLDVAWPPRSWWIDRLPMADRSSNLSLSLTPAGLDLRPPPATGATAGFARTMADWRRRFAAVPETGPTTLRRRLRRVVEAVRRRSRSVY